MRYPLDRLQRLRRHLIDHIDLLGNQRRNLSVGVLAVVEVVDFVEIEIAGPPVARTFQDRFLADCEIDQGERAGADRVGRQVGFVVFAEAAMHDRRRIVVEVLRNGQRRLLQIELDGVLVDDLDGAGDTAFLAVGALFDHGAEQAEVRRAGVGIEPAVDRVRDVFGRELVAVRPGDALAQLEHPLRQVVRGFPSLGEIRNGGVVRLRAGQVFDNEPGNVRFLNPVECRRIGHFLHLH